MKSFRLFDDEIWKEVKKHLKNSFHEISSIDNI